MKTIPEFPNYAITKEGRIWSIQRKNSRGEGCGGRWLKLRINNRGYVFTKLRKARKDFYFLVHRLILITYIGPCPKGMQCRHLNGKQTDNRLINLCWGTREENMQDAIKHGTHVSLRYGSSSIAAKLTEQQVRMIIHMSQTGLFMQREIAKIYNIGETTVGNIVRRKTWKHLYVRV